MKNILITGGAGYVGNVLVPSLLEDGYRVTVYDSLFFHEDTLPISNPNLKLVNGDIRNIEKFKSELQNIDTVMHLACISNDPSFELNSSLSTSINFECFEPLVLESKKAGIKRFIYCSSSSVYGISDKKNVTEDHELVPLTQYNKYKAMCEPILFRHQSDEFICTIIRPATLCGYSPRCRLDLTVNILTNHAYNTGKITVFGGSQKRPNLHIKDKVDVYKLLLTAPSEKISGQIFNVGYQNHTVSEIATIVQKTVAKFKDLNNEIIIKEVKSNDTRSYHINSDKIYRVLGYKPIRTLEDAVLDLCDAFSKNKLPNSMTDDKYHNVRVLNNKNIS